MGQAGLRLVLLVGVALAGLLAKQPAAFARHRMSFVPGQHGYAMARRSGRHGYVRRRYGHAISRHRGPSAEPQTGGSPGAVPPGFKMEDGVLTYPAPARFQPQNLKPH